MAKAAAGDNHATPIGGASTMRQYIAAGLADDVHMDLRAMLLGDGLHVFERSEALPIELPLLDVIQTPGATNVRYRVRK